MIWAKKHWKRILTGLIATVVTLYALPFIIYFIAPNTRQFMYGEMLYKPIVDSLTKEAKTDSAKAMVLFDYVAKTCKQPGVGQNPKYDFAHEVLLNKTASCDQQVWLLMNLLRVKNIDAHMVFLYGHDSISHHTVLAAGTEKGRDVMFDPFYKLYIVNGKGKQATIGDVMKGFIAYSSNTMPDDYLDLYETRYPFKYHSDNKLSATKKIVRTLLYTDYYIFGNLFRKPFVALY